MKNRGRSKRNSGFTMVEMLATVAILVILLAVSAVAVIGRIDQLKITELDNAAREIFMAAENRAVLLSGAQRLEGLVQEKDSANPEKIINRATLTDLTELAPHTDEENYYVYSTADNNINNDLLPYGSIDQTLLDNGDFYIVYDLKSGSVTDVFYAEKARNNETPLGTLVSANKDFSTFYKYWASDRSARLDMKNPSMGADGTGAANPNSTLVGWYNGYAAQSVTTGPDTKHKPYIDVTILNEEELTVRVTVKWDSTIDTEVKKALEGDGGSLTVMLDGTAIDLVQKYKFELNAVNYSGSDPRVKLKESEYRPDGYIYRCTWVLDSLEQNTAGAYLYQFKDFVKNTSFVPGNDFTITAEIKSNSDAFESATDSESDNSLFASLSGGIAEIAYLRHLQNLSADTANTIGFDSGVKKNVTGAKQIATIWGDGNGGYEEQEGDGSYKRVGYFKSPHRDEYGNEYYYNFCPITNENLTGTYDGNCTDGANTIEGLYINPNLKEGFNKVTDNQGLFGTNYGTVQDVGLVNAVIVGTKNVGGFVGQNQGTVKNCNRTTANNIKIIVTGTGAQNIGGIVGLHQPDGTKPTGIENCVNQMPVGSSTADYVGGIVGKFDGSKATDTNKATMQNCYNGIADTAGTDGAVVISGASNVGGLAGSSAGGANALILDSKNYAYVNGSGDYVGGLVGDNGCLLGTDNSTVKHTCANHGNVKGNKIVGGVAGRSSGTVDGANTLIGGIVVEGNERVGGYVGVNIGTVRNCTRPKNTDANKIEFKIAEDAQYIGGIMGQSGDETHLGAEVINCRNEADLDYGGRNNVGGIVGINYGLVGCTSSLDEDTIVKKTGLIEDEKSVCVNTGTITGKDNVGGIVGNNVSGTVAGLDEDTNAGKVGGANNVGGFVGYNGEKGTLVRLTNSGVTVETVGEGTHKNFGGIVGENHGLVIYCRNLKDVDVKAQNVGGIAGQVIGSGIEADPVGKVRFCYNTAWVGNEKVNSACLGFGGIAGDSQGGMIQQCYNIGMVIGWDYVGGILGRSTGGSKPTYLQSLYNHGSSYHGKFDYDFEHRAGTESLILIRVEAMNPEATHYGSILGSCRAGFYGVSDDGSDGTLSHPQSHPDPDKNLYWELQKGRLLGKDDPSKNTAVGDFNCTTDNHCEYEGYLDGYKVNLGNEKNKDGVVTTADSGIAVAMMNRCFYRSSESNSSSGSGMRNKAMLARYGVGALNETGGDFWDWLGGDHTTPEEGFKDRFILKDFSDTSGGAWRMDGITGQDSVTVDVFNPNAFTQEYSVTLGLNADANVPTGDAKWSVSSSNTNVIADADIDNGVLTFTVNEPKHDDGKVPAVPVYLNVKYKVTDSNGKDWTYTKAITVNFGANAKLVVWGTGSTANHGIIFGSESHNRHGTTDKNGNNKNKILALLARNSVDDPFTNFTQELPNLKITYAHIENGSGIWATIYDATNRSYLGPDEIQLGGEWSAGFSTDVLRVQYTVTYNGYTVTGLTQDFIVYKDKATADAAKASAPADDDPTIEVPPELDGPGLDDAPVAALPPDPEGWGTLDPEDPEPEGNKSAEPEAGESPAEDETDPDPEENTPGEPAGEATDGEVTAGEGTDGEIPDNEVTDGEILDSEVADGEILDGEVQTPIKVRSRMAVNRIALRYRIMVRSKATMGRVELRSCVQGPVQDGSGLI